MKNKMAALLAALMASALCATGCGSSTQAVTEPGPAEETVTEMPEEEEEAEAETEIPAAEEPAQDGDTLLLVVSFGTSYNDSRDLTIGAIEDSIADAFPSYPVRRAFTAQIIIDKLAERDGLEIDNVTRALDRAAADGFKNLIVQPTHLMNGLEYMDLVDELAEYESDFDRIALGEPLLTSDADYEAVIKAITDDTRAYDDGETAIVYMGHGTEAESNQIYGTMQEKLAAAGYANYFVGTVEAEPTLEDVTAALKEAGIYKKVVMQPLMVVAGDHAHNDMAGEEDSWKTVLEAEGYEVESRMVGLGELPGVRNVYVQHAQEAVGNAGEKGSDGISYDQVASREEQVRPQEVGVEGMLPVYGTDVADGVYEVRVESSSSMFRVESAKLTVDSGEMTAVLTMGGTGYLRLYMGTGAEAAESREEEYIEYVETEGKHTYTVPVEALDMPIACAAFSRNREKWYDRQILFEAESLPAESVLAKLPDYEALRQAAKEKRIETMRAGEEGSEKPAGTEEEAGEEPAGTEAKAGEAAEASTSEKPAWIEMEDGEYAIVVELSGGSGRSAVNSPAGLIVKDGLAWARIQWSSSSYDYMVVGGKRYLPVNEEGYSTFEIPILTFNEPMAVIADTTAMSTPHEVDYALTFYGDQVMSKDETPQAAAQKVVYMVLLIVAVCALVSWNNKRKRNGRR